MTIDGREIINWKDDENKYGLVLQEVNLHFTNAMVTF